MAFLAHVKILLGILELVVGSLASEDTCNEDLERVSWELFRWTQSISMQSERQVIYLISPSQWLHRKAQLRSSHSLTQVMWNIRRRSPVSIDRSRTCHNAAKVYESDLLELLVTGRTCGYLGLHEGIH